RRSSRVPSSSTGSDPVLVAPAFLPVLPIQAKRKSTGRNAGATRKHNTRSLPMFSRRTLLKSTASGFGYLPFAALAHEQAARAAPGALAANPLAPKKPHFPGTAKRVIFLCMDGGPSHVDTFDYKPKLTADDGKAPPRGRFGKLMGSPFKFEKRGESGLW